MGRKDLTLEAEGDHTPVPATCCGSTARCSAAYVSERALEILQDGKDMMSGAMCVQQCVYGDIGEVRDTRD